jgi:hypothetical protein
MPGEPEVRGSATTASPKALSVAALLPTGTAVGDLALIAIVSVGTTPPIPKTPAEATAVGAASAAYGTSGNKRVSLLAWKVVTTTDFVAGHITCEVEGAEAPSNKLVATIVAVKTGTFNASNPIDNHAAKWEVEETLTPQYGSITPNHVLSLALAFATFTGVLSSDPPAEWTSVETYTADEPRVISHNCGESTAKTPSTTIGKSITAASAWMIVTVQSSSVGGPVSVKAAAGVKVAGFGLSAGAAVVRAAAIIRTVIGSKGGPVTVRAAADVNVFGPPIIYEPLEIGAAAAVNVAGEPARANIENVRAGARVSTAGVKFSGGAVRILAGARVGVKVVISLTPPTRMVIRGTTTRGRLRATTTTARLRGG